MYVNRIPLHKAGNFQRKKFTSYKEAGLGGGGVFMRETRTSVSDIVPKDKEVSSEKLQPLAVLTCI